MDNHLQFQRRILWSQIKLTESHIRLLESASKVAELKEQKQALLADSFDLINIHADILRQYRLVCDEIRSKPGDNPKGDHTE